MANAKAEAVKSSGKVQEKSNLKGQISKFAIVGILNTLIDVVIVNILVLNLGLDPVISNIVGVSVAVVNSYAMNKYWTFGDKKKEHLAEQFGLFVLLSLVGLAINTVVFKFLLDLWVWPGAFANTLVGTLSLDSVFSEEFVTLNFAKAWAIGVSMFWNFISYRKWAFKDK